MSEPSGLEGINGGDGDHVVSLADLNAQWFLDVVAKARADLEATPERYLPLWYRTRKGES